MNRKKILIVLILRILETDSDKNNPVTCTEIARRISEAYPCDRKTVSRNIKFLTELKFPIVKTTRGFYMDKQAFTREEITYVIDSVRSNPVAIDGKEELCERLYTSLSRYYTR